MDEFGQNDSDTRSSLKMLVIVGCVSFWGVRALQSEKGGLEASSPRQISRISIHSLANATEIDVGCNLDPNNPSLAVSSQSITLPSPESPVMLKMSASTASDLAVDWGCDVLFRRNGSPITGGRAYFHPSRDGTSLASGMNFLGPAAPGNYEVEIRLFDRTNSEPLATCSVPAVVNAESSTDR